MSLVANYTSSEEDSENEDNDGPADLQIKSTSPPPVTSNGGPSRPSDGKLRLPQPLRAQSPDLSDSEEHTSKSFKINLPKPSKTSVTQSVEEEDDEFLHKTASAYNVEKPPPLSLPTQRKANNRQPVKIFLPTLSEIGGESRTVTVAVPEKPIAKGGGLINMLPPPKSILGIASNFKSSTPSTASDNKAKSTMIPHAVKKQIDNRTKSSKGNVASALTAKTSTAGEVSSDSDDDEAEDFFSLNDEKKLPEVSANEILGMVARKTAKLAEASQKIQKMMVNDGQEDAESPADEYESSSQSAAGSIQQRERDIQALCGSRAKRARKEEINFIELSHEEVMPNRDEWLRSQLTATTEYQPRGLVGFDDPGTGTKKKHQITYLAYQAKANEQELEAMWAANRNSRRQTQSKYGF